MNDINSDFPFSKDDVSLFNIKEFANPIEIEQNEKKTLCFYSDFKRDTRKMLVEINLLTNTAFVYPTNTIENSTFFLEPKYEKNILEFAENGNIMPFEGHRGIYLQFEGYNVEINKNDNNDDAIYGLPKGFTQTIKFGLGLEKKYKVIVSTLSRYFKECEKIIISKTRPTEIANKSFVINDEDFDMIRRGIDRNNDLYQKESMEAKESLVYDTLLHGLNSERYPTLKREPQKDIIYKILKNTDFKKISQGDKQSLSKLKDNTDLSYLTILVTEFENKLRAKHTEATYQTFFEENPLLLTLISGSPYVQFKNQAYVGGKSFDNSNGQYPDFLQKHKITNNTFIIEIKTPHTNLLEKTPYRKTGVYVASKDLSGAISQLLTQKHRLETEIASLIMNSEDREVEAYNVQGLIIIGQLSELEEKDMKRSFELYRNNQKNLRVITYDECLEQLKFFISQLENNIIQ